MIYNERKRTAAVEGELWILRQELTRVQQQKLKSDKQVKMAEEETLRAVDVATRLRAAAEADTAALQQELKVFHAAEDRLKSLNLDHYQDGVLERIAQAVLKGNLDRTMDTHMLVSLAHNANLDASSKQRHATLYSHLPLPSVHPSLAHHTHARTHARRYTAARVQARLKTR